MFRDRRPWLRMYLRMAAAMGFLACAEPQETAEAPGAASPLALEPSRLEALLAPGWRTAGNRGEDRSAESATLLQDGRVLLAGGEGPNGIVSSAEMYDPVPGTWTLTGAMLVPRFMHTATLLPTGTVLVVGGLNSSGSLAGAELYDPATGRWTATRSLSVARYGHTATLLPDGQVLIVGGYTSSGATGSAELYDPGTRSWTSTGPLVTACFGHTATLLPTGEVLVAGGEGNSGLLTTSQVYDPGAGTWSLTGSLATARKGHTATLLPEGQVLVSGGLNGVSPLTSAELYDPALKRWSRVGVMEVPDTILGERPPDPTNQTSATFTFSASVPVSRYDCWLDSFPYASCSSPATYASLAEGVHTFEVRAVGTTGELDPSPATYTWRVDTIAPNTTLTGQPPNPSNSTSATFTFTASETGASFECKLGTSSFAPCPSPITYSSLAAGSYTFQVRARDAAGNIDPSPASYAWTVDRTAPETTITAQPRHPSNSTSATFSFTSNEATASFECKLDAEIFTPCTSPKTYSGLAEGNHTFRVRARDAAGNLDASPATHTWTVDTTAPNTFIPSPPPNSSSATITFTSNESPVTFECKLDEATFASCTSPVTLSNLPEGSHTFQVRARDSAGNLDPTPASVSWTVDTTAPDTTLTSQPPNSSNSNSATFTFSSDDPTATFECKLDAEPFTPCTSPKTYTGLAEGSHTFSVRAKDAAGNVDPSAASYTWAVDTIAPDTTITSPPPNPINPTFTFTSNESPVTFECKLDNEAFTPCTSPKTYIGLAEDSHTFSVRARDAAGNVDPTVPTYTWTVDKTAPDTTLTSQPPNSSNSNSATFTFSSDDPTATFECNLDAEPFTPCTSPKTYIGLLEGSHTFSVRAKDAAGNVDPSAASYTWAVDTIAPDTTITSPPPNNPNATITFTSNEMPVTFECKLDAAAFAPCTSPVSLSNLSEGSHTFQVYARDAAGNLDPTPASISWTVDTTAPDTTLTSQPPTRTRETSARLTFSSEEGSAFECSLDEAPFEACTSPSDYVELMEGVHLFQVRAKDMAGNVDPTPASHTWAVDLTAPDTTLIQKPADPSHTESATFSFASNESDAGFECKRDETPAFTPCTSPIEYTGLTEGPHTFQVRAVDAAGHTDATPASFTWVVDARPPEAPIIQSPAQGATITERQPSISGTAQPGSTVALQLDGAPLGTTTANALGQWTLIPASQLNDGPHTLTATAQDGAGTSAPSAPVSFTIEASGDPDGGDDDPDGGGCGCEAGSADTSMLLWGLGLLATLSARRRARPTLNHP